MIFCAILFSAAAGFELDEQINNLYPNTSENNTNETTTSFPSTFEPSSFPSSSPTILLFNSSQVIFNITQNIYNITRDMYYEVGVFASIKV